MGEWMAEKAAIEFERGSAFNVRDVFRSVRVRLLLPYVFYVSFRWFVVYFRRSFSLPLSLCVYVSQLHLIQLLLCACMCVCSFSFFFFGFRQTSKRQHTRRIFRDANREVKKKEKLSRSERQFKKCVYWAKQAGPRCLMHIHTRTSRCAPCFSFLSLVSIDMWVYVSICINVLYIVQKHIDCIAYTSCVERTCRFGWSAHSFARAFDRSILLRSLRMKRTEQDETRWHEAKWNKKNTHTTKYIGKTENAEEWKQNKTNRPNWTERYTPRECTIVMERSWRKWRKKTAQIAKENSYTLNCSVEWIQ